MAKTVLRQIVGKLDEIDNKVSALLIKEEKPTKTEIKAINAGKKQFAEGKFKPWGEIKKAKKYG